MSSSVCYNIVVFGEPSVGKTCFIDQFCYGKSFVMYDPGEGNPHRVIDVDDRSADLSLMDLSTSFLKPDQSTPHTEWAKKILAAADGIVLLYDITDLESFENLIGQAHNYLWHCRESERARSRLAGGENRVAFGCVLVGNKQDLACSKRASRVVSRDEADEWASSQGFRSVEVDSLSRAGPDIALQLLMKNIWKLEKLGLASHGLEEQQDERETVQRNSGSLRNALRRITHSSKP